MEQNRQIIRTLIRTLYDFQDMRVRMGNRLKKKKDGQDQKNIDIDIDIMSIPVMVDVYQSAEENEKKIEKALQQELKVFPIYTEFLKGVKGVGPLMASVIISEYDIHIATTVSKLWAFTGLAPGETFGKKWVPKTKANKKKYKDVIIKEGKSKYLIKSDIKIPMDKKTTGFMCPFNSWLRTKMCGVLGASFLKSNSPYREYYDNMKHRLESKNWGTPSKNPVNKKKPCAKHQHQAANRYMIKMFLKDLYIVWRNLEGLPVRPPYAEEYLNKKHSA